MIGIKWIISSLLIAGIVSCQHKQMTLQAHANKFAKLESQAIELREKRFALANQIRFATDSIHQFEKIINTSRLHKKLALFNAEKELLLQQSLALAEIIKHDLSMLMKNELQNKNDRAAFNDLLNKALTENGHVRNL